MTTEPDPKMAFCFPIGPWHDWFAWHPVRTYDRRLVWFRWCRRRAMQTNLHLHGPLHFWWQHHVERIK